MFNFTIESLWKNLFEQRSLARASIAENSSARVGFSKGRVGSLLTKNRVAASTISTRLLEKWDLRSAFHPIRFLASMNQLSMSLPAVPVSFAMDARTWVGGYGLCKFSRSHW